MRDCSRLGRVYCRDISSMKDHRKARTVFALVLLDLWMCGRHVKLLVGLSLSGSLYSLPWPFVSMRGYQDPAAFQWVVPPMGYVIEDGSWHDDS